MYDYIHLSEQAQWNGSYHGKVGSWCDIFGFYRLNRCRWRWEAPFLPLRQQYSSPFHHGLYWMLLPRNLGTRPAGRREGWTLVEEHREHIFSVLRYATPHKRASYSTKQCFCTAYARFCVDCRFSFLMIGLQVFRLLRFNPRRTYLRRFPTYNKEKIKYLKRRSGRKGGGKGNHNITLRKEGKRNYGLLPIAHFRREAEKGTDLTTFANECGFSRSEIHEATAGECTVVLPFSLGIVWYTVHNPEAIGCTINLHKPDAKRLVSHTLFSTSSFAQESLLFVACVAGGLSQCGEQ